MNTVQSLARAICPEAALLKELALAEDDPARYVKTYAKRLALRGVDAPTKDLLWFALFDGLIARRKAVEIDHREAAEDFLPALKKLLPRGSKLPTVAELDALAPASTRTLLDVVGDCAKGQLFTIDSGGDSYVVVVGKDLTVSRRVRKLGGAKLEKLRAAAARESKADERQSARRSGSQKSGGPRWQALMADCENYVNIVLDRLWSANTAAQQRVFIAAFLEAPPAHFERMSRLALLLQAPEKAARTLDPLWVLNHLKYVAETKESIGQRVRVLEILARRIRLGSNPKTTHAFWAAAFISVQFNAVARRALPAKTLSGWARLAESAGSINARLSLRWMGDEQTLEKFMAKTKKPTRGEVLSYDQQIVTALASAYGRKISWKS